VTRSGDLSQPLTVTLASNDTTEATVPATVTISAGQASATFAVNAVDDTISDGNQTVTISVAASGYNSGSTTLVVTDNEGPQFTAVSFDFGTASSPVASGFKQVTSTTTYVSSVGYGWLSGTIQEFDRKGNLTDLNRDFNQTTDGTFVVNVPAGTYSVTITMGDAKLARDNMGVWLEGVQVDMVSTAAGQFIRKTYSVTVSDGQLTLRLHDLGGSDPSAVINGLEITRTSGGPLRMATGVGVPAGTAARPSAVSPGGSLPWSLLLSPSLAGVAADRDKGLPVSATASPAGLVGEVGRGLVATLVGATPSSPSQQRRAGTTQQASTAISDFAWVSGLLDDVADLWRERGRR
jgi:hypothetical protein